MEEFEFDGNWTREIQLIEFAKLNNPDFARKDHDANNGIFGLTIYDAQNFNPDPEKEQINTINYLTNPQNQKEIIESIFLFSRDIIYPEYKEYLSEEEYPECYPSLNTPKDLYNLIGINEVMIYNIQKEGFAYYVLGFNSCLDYEHGLYLTLHKSRVLDHAQMGDLDQKKIYDDLGFNYEEHLEKHHEREKNKELKTYMPHPKYGKLKPWQERANNYYPYGLLHGKQNDKLIEFLQIKENHLKFTGRVLNAAVINSYTEAIELLISLKPEKVISAIITAIRKNQNDLVKRLVQLEKSDLNKRVGFDSLLYNAFVNLAKQYGYKEEKGKAMEMLDLFLSVGVNPNLKDKFNRDTNYCIGNIREKELVEELRELLKEKIKQYKIE